MKVDVVKQEKNIVELDIEIDADIVAQEYSKACRKISERMNIPGFRKGKAPRAIVEKYVGPEKIQKEILDRLLPNVFADTISEHQFDLATEPFVESFKLQLGTPLSVKAKLELKPDVKLTQYKNLQIDVPKFEHPEDSLEKELKALSEKFSKLEPIVGRPATDKDIVIIDYNGTIDGEPIKGGSAKSHQLDLGNSNFIQGFAEQIVGKNVGDEFIIDVKFPDDYFDSELCGKEAKFEIKVNEMKQKIVPEVNDELAQKLGPFQSIDELKEDLKSYLDKSKTTENESRAEQAVLTKIIDQTEVEIPDSMINKEARVLLEEVQSKLKSQGISWEQVLETQGHESMWNNLRDEASKRVKTSLVLGAIAKEENLQLKDNDFVDRVKDLSTLYNTDEESVFKHISQNPDLAQTLSQQIMGQKVVDFLVENNEIKYIDDVPQENESNNE